MGLTHISLFTGIGGIDLAAEWASFETVLMVENNPYCQKILRKHWPNVPIIGDIKDVTRERISTYSDRQRCEDALERQDTLSESIGENEPRAGWRDRTKDRGNFPPITLITGGFPCQPVSQAGKRRGKEDDRWLWPEMLRVISEVRPTWVVAENVAGLLNMGFDDCLSDLESQGYETASFLIPACGVNTPHRRNRIFIVGYSEKLYQYGSNSQSQESRTQVPKSRDTSSKADVADTNCGSGSTPRQNHRLRSSSNAICGSGSGRDWWAVEPDVGRVAHGIPNRVDRLKGLGNAVVPQQIYPILQAIADIEKGDKVI